MGLCHREQNREGGRPKADNIQQVGPGCYIWYQSMVIFHFINHIHSLHFSTNAKISSKGSMKFLQLFTQLNTNPFNSHANK
jgi:hypothetical protein